MNDTLTVVVEDGVLKPLEPVDLPVGRSIEIKVVRVVPTPEEREERLRGLEETLARIREEAAKYPPEWWDEFQRDLQANRLNFQERVFFEE